MTTGNQSWLNTQLFSYTSFLNKHLIRASTKPRLHSAALSNLTSPLVHLKMSALTPPAAPWRLPKVYQDANMRRVSRYRPVVPRSMYRVSAAVACCSRRPAAVTVSGAASQGFVLFAHVEGQQAAQVELLLVLLHVSIAQTSASSSYSGP